MWRLKGQVPRRAGETLKYDDLMELASGRRDPTGLERRVSIKGSVSAEALEGFSMKSIVSLDLEEPTFETIDILAMFPNVDNHEISTNSGARLLRWTQRVLAVFPQSLKSRINISCESCVLSNIEESEILSNLGAILPGCANVTLRLPASLRREIVVRVLPSCASLSWLSIEVPDFDCCVPYLESPAFLTLQDIWWNLKAPWTNEQADFFAQKIRANRYLRSFSFSSQSPEASLIILTAAVEMRSILQISCYDWQIYDISPELMEKLRTCRGLHPRKFYMIGVDESVFFNLFAEFPSQFVVLGSSLPNAEALMSIETQLRSPACALRELAISVENSGLDRLSLLSFAGAVARCPSLTLVHLMGLTELPWVGAIILILNEAVCLKRLYWDDNPVEHEQIVSLSGAMATNEVLEYVGTPDTLRPLAGAIKVRNVAKCVGRCRFLLLSWMLDYQRRDNTLFDAAVVFEILVLSELDWEENQRSSAETRGLAAVAAELQIVGKQQENG